MQIKTITVRYGRTQSLESYSNVRPEITLSAELGDGDDPETAWHALLTEARVFVEEAIDQAIEQDGRAAKFSREPRYQVITTTTVGGGWSRDPVQEPPERLVIVLPNLPGLERQRRSWWTHPTANSRKLRLVHALAVAEEYMASHEGHHLIIAVDGDRSQIPAWVFEPVPEQAAPAPVVAGLSDDDERDGIADAYDDEGEDE